VKQIAVLLTCHNRKDKTIACLTSLYNCVVPENFSINVFLVDDGSTDGTKEAVSIKYPLTNIIQGDGSLFWAGGMQLAWKTAKDDKSFDGYLLLNDDVILVKSALMELAVTNEYCVNKYGKAGIYVGSTIDSKSKMISYGGRLVTKKLFSYSMKIVEPKPIPQVCTLANANILLVMSSVVEEIGIFDNKFTHGIADYDYTLTAFENGIPLIVCPNVNGICEDDHGRNWVTGKSNLQQRIKYLFSPKGLAYRENMYYLRKHFPAQLPYYFLMFWLKTFFPIIWTKFK